MVDRMSLALRLLIDLRAEAALQYIVEEAHAIYLHHWHKQHNERVWIILNGPQLPGKEIGED